MSLIRVIEERQRSKRAMTMQKTMPTQRRSIKVKGNNDRKRMNRVIIKVAIHYMYYSKGYTQWECPIYAPINEYTRQ